MVGLSACSGVTTEADEVAIRYEGSGALEPRVNPTFMECVPPSKGDYGDMGDGVYTYPFGGQTLKFSDRAEEARKVVSRELNLPPKVVDLAWPRMDWDASLGAPVIEDIQNKANFLKNEKIIREAVDVRVHR